MFTSIIPTDSGRCSQLLPATVLPLVSSAVVSLRSLLFIIFLLLCESEALAGVPRAIANAQQGLSEALGYPMPNNRKFKHGERWEKGFLVYKFSIRKIDEHSFKIRVTGFDKDDEVGIITKRGISSASRENQYLWTPSQGLCNSARNYSGT